ncbi:unnamed protein product [Prorocentrum cordatum]|uniref:Uncharacterized protein n=1 Tax=Prorocentrum cordatum TaxID=2364126 RepID=A0ABN9RCU9_9DINO|nr:unnamed protein product [Polarella glacialis]
MGRHIEETRGSGGSAAAASEAVGSNRSLALPQQARRKGHHQGDGVPSLKQQTALRPPAGWISRPAGRGKGREDEEERTRERQWGGGQARHAHEGRLRRGGGAHGGGAGERRGQPRRQPLGGARRTDVCFAKMEPHLGAVTPGMGLGL